MKKTNEGLDYVKVGPNVQNLILFRDLQVRFRDPFIRFDNFSHSDRDRIKVLDSSLDKVANIGIFSYHFSITSEVSDFSKGSSFANIGLSLTPNQPNAKLNLSKSLIKRAEYWLLMWKKAWNLLLVKPATYGSKHYKYATYFDYLCF